MDKETKEIIIDILKNYDAVKDALDYKYSKQDNVCNELIKMPLVDIADYIWDLECALFDIADELGIREEVLYG